MTEVRLYSAACRSRIIVSLRPIPCLSAHARETQPSEVVVDRQHARASKKGANQYKKQVMDMEQKVKKVTIEHRDMGNTVVAAKAEAKNVGLVTSPVTL
jgi:hypothetical protein